MDPNLEEDLRNKRNYTGHWCSWGIFGIELAPGVAGKKKFPAGYSLEGDTLSFKGSISSPYSRIDGMIVITLDGLEFHVLLEKREVRWMINSETRHVLWVNEEHRPK